MDNPIYIILTGNTRFDLMNKVNDKINEGYVVIGGVTHVAWVNPYSPSHQLDHEWSQAMKYIL